MKNKWIFRWSVRIVIVLWVLWGNFVPIATRITVTDPDVPAGFDGFRIVQVSDLHNAEFGKDHERLLKLIQKAEPDIIAITGDLVDSYHTNVEVALAFIAQVVKIAPCYYVTGNHEGSLSEYRELKKALDNYGVTILENRKVTLERNGSKINLQGIDDPYVCNDGIIGEANAVAKARLKALEIDQSQFNILLSHRPDMADAYNESGVDLVLSGHVHGGQFRVPFLGGLYAPGQGLWPEYDGGVYELGQTTMIVSRGLGNSSFPLRLNNNPEILVITLQLQ